MIDWKEIYGQVKPLFDTYYQWQVIFVVVEGLLLLFLNYLTYRYLIKKKYAWLVFFLMICGNLFFGYQSYQKLGSEIQVVQFQENDKMEVCYEEHLDEVKKKIELEDLKPIYCPRYPSIKDVFINLFQKAFDLKDFSFEKIQNISTLNKEGLISLKPIKSTFIEVKDFRQHYFEFELFYREKFNTEERLEKHIEEFKNLTPNSSSPVLEDEYWKFEYIESINQSNYFFNQTHSICIKKNNKYYPLLLITRQGEIIYKISQEELEEYIF